MSGDSPWFVGDAMAAVVHGVQEVAAHIGRPPVIVGGLAVMARLSVPYRATTDVDVMDRPVESSPPGRRGSTDEAPAGRADPATTTPARG